MFKSQNSKTFYFSVIYILKIVSNFVLRISNFTFKEPQEGFTLIELIIVFSVMAVLTTTGIASYSAYNTAQTFRNAVSDVAGVLTTAKSRALSQEKPDQCLNQTLEGYQVDFMASGRNYSLNVLCGGSTYAIDTGNLPPQTSFTGGSSGNFFFIVSQGSVTNPGSVTVQGLGKSSTITVDGEGNVTVK